MSIVTATLSALFILAAALCLLLYRAEMRKQPREHVRDMSDDDEKYLALLFSRRDSATLPSISAWRGYCPQTETAADVVWRD